MNDSDPRVQRELDAVADRVRAGWIPAHVYSDPDVFAAECRTVFRRSWVFLAHESEIPRPGDFVLRRVVDDSFIVVRGDDGQVRVLFNMCLHRGMQVCRAERGNASHFRCPYHAWSYRNDGALTGLPFHEDAYGGDRGLVRDEHRLLEPGGVEIRHGMVFVRLSASGPSLDDYIGDFGFYLDIYVRQSPAGLEFHGPQRWRVNANWKIGCENFVGDMYHTPFTHRSVVDISLFREPKANKRKEGVLYFAGRGGGTTYKLPPGDFRSRMRYVGYPDPMIDRAERTWGAGQHALVDQDGFMVSAATLFPNLSFVHNWPQIRGDGDVVPFISLRQWHPVSATETEVLSWFAVDAEAPDDFKRDSYRAYLMCFGSSGMFEQDDVENWVSITASSRGSMARELLLNSRMGLDVDGNQLSAPLDGFAGPGEARVGFGEFNQRRWLGLWADELTASMHDGVGVDVGAVGAGLMTGHRRALPHDDPRHLIAHHFLIEEAAILDAQRWEDWLSLLHPTIRYVMPVRVTVALGEPDESDDMAHFDEDLYSLRKRVERLRTEHAWTEDPPSRTRHVVTNVRTTAGGDSEIDVESTVLLFRSRGDTRPPETVCAGRIDRLVSESDHWLLAARRITVDEAVLRTQNLAIFL